MTALFQNASDDQMALALCAAAFVFSGLVMYFSHHVGRYAQRVRLHDETKLAELEARRHDAVEPARKQAA